MKKILVAGVGQLGSRYLQGLSKFHEGLEITAYDKNPKSLETASNRWNEVSKSKHHSLILNSSLNNIRKNFDLVILACTADNRLSLTKEIAAKTSVKNWIFEKILATSPNEIIELKKILKKPFKAWVNTNLLLQTLYVSIKKKYSINGPISAKFFGFSGLICNAIHYIDLISRWNSCSISSIDCSQLKKIWCPAKRIGFYENSGQLIIKFSDSSVLKLIEADNQNGTQGEIFIQQDLWTINELKGIALSDKKEIISAKMSLLSELVPSMLAKIFSSSHIDLPTIEQSAAQHIPFLDALRCHWNINMPYKVDRLPIT